MLKAVCTFPKSAPAANPVFFRTYSRINESGVRENYLEVVDRNIDGLQKFGRLTLEEVKLIRSQMEAIKALPSGRWMWVGGTDWIEKPENFSGAYNCTSTEVVDWKAFGLMMDLAMQGCGTGAMLEPKFISSLPVIQNKLNVAVVASIGLKPANIRRDETDVLIDGNSVLISVGDSRTGWVSSYQALLELTSDDRFDGEIDIAIDLSNVRPEGEKLKGFGGVANPIKLPDLYERCAAITNKAIGRKLDSVECCLLIDEAAVTIVAGNVRRSAGMRQAGSDDQRFAVAKEGLWVQSKDGSWSIDPDRDALRMANHTRVFHQKPTEEECINAVHKQFYSGEGAIQWAGEAVARSNADLLDTPEKRQRFLDAYSFDAMSAATVLLDLGSKPNEVDHRMGRYGLNPCLTGDTQILTFEGVKTFAELAETENDILVWCIDLESNQPKLSMMRRPHKTGFNTPVLEVEFDSGLKVKATPNHSFFTTHRNKVEAKDLKPGMSVCAFAIHQHRDGHLRILRNDKTRNHQARQWFVHHIVAEHFGIDRGDDGVIHHIDGNPHNNHPSNLEVTNPIDHNRSHYANRVLNGFFHKTPGGVAKEILDSRELVANHKVVAVREVGAEDVYNGMVERYHNYIVVDPSPVGKSYISGIVSANCGEILGKNFHCNLAEVHLNQLDPSNFKEQEDAFAAGALSVAALLNHYFQESRYQYSREIDPIVGVSFTGLFDFFVHTFGVEWLRWWEQGRPDTVTGLQFKRREQEYLTRWKEIVHRVVWDYCDRHGIKRPNRCTTVQPAGTKSLLTGASSGWHPPKSQRFIRRITFRKNDPVALACVDYGYSVVPSQSDKDENGRLLDNPFDPRCTEWLVEIPTEVSWANLPGADSIDISKFSALAQMDFYMQVQKHYTTHNTSATIELRDSEIEAVGERIYEAIQTDEGYISAALLARFDDLETFPRLPFEPINKETYDRLCIEVLERRKIDDFKTALDRHDSGELVEAGPAGCDSDKCLMSTNK